MAERRHRRRVCIRASTIVAAGGRQNARTSSGGARATAVLDARRPGTLGARGGFADRARARRLPAWVSVTVGSTTCTSSLSDLAVLAVAAVSAVRSGAGTGSASLGAGRWAWIAIGGLPRLGLRGGRLPARGSDPYPWHEHVVTRESSSSTRCSRRPSRPVRAAGRHSSCSSRSLVAWSVCASDARGRAVLRLADPGRLAAPAAGSLRSSATTTSPGCREPWRAWRCAAMAVPAWRLDRGIAVAAGASGVHRADRLRLDRGRDRAAGSRRSSPLAFGPGGRTSRGGARGDPRASRSLCSAESSFSAAATSVVAPLRRDRQAGGAARRRDATSSGRCSSTIGWRVFLDHPVAGAGWQASIEE